MDTAMIQEMENASQTDTDESVQETAEEQIEEEELGVARGDAQYHAFTGRGPKAKHESEIYKDITYAGSPENATLQQAVIAKLKIERQISIDRKRDKQKAAEQEENELKTSHQAEYEVMEEIWQSLETQKTAIENSRNIAAEKKARAEYLSQECKSISRRYKDIDKEIEKLSSKENKIKGRKQKLKKNLVSAWVALTAIRNKTADSRKVLFAERREKYYMDKMAKGQKTYEAYQAELKALRDKIKEKEDKKLELQQYMERVSLQIATLFQEAEAEEESADIQEQSRTAMKIANEELFQEEWFVKIKELQEKNARRESKISRMEAEKEKTEEQVLSADIMSVVPDGLPGSVNGIYVDGNMYLSSGEVISEGDIGKEGFSDDYDATEMKTLIEEQKIVNALRQKEIFQYINSDNLMEYTTYDEEAGNFDLPEIVDPAMAKDAIIGQLKKIRESLQAIGMDSELDTILQPVLSGGEIDPGKEVTAALLQQAQKIEATKRYLGKDSAENTEKMLDPQVKESLNFIAEMTSGQPIIQILASFPHPELVINSISSAFVDIGKTVGNMGLDVAKDFVGWNQFEQIKGNEQKGEGSVSGAKPMLILNGILAAVKPLALGIDMLAGDIMKAHGLVNKAASVWGEYKLMGFDIVGGANTSIFGAVSSGVQIGKGLASGVIAWNEMSQMQDAADKKRAKGQNRYGRMLETAAVEKAVKRLEGFVDAASGAVSLAFALTGIGGLAATGISTLSSIIAKKIGGVIYRSRQKNNVLNSPEVLGGINYDKNLISDKHFDKLFASVTGINDREQLYKVIQVTDSIDLHYAMRLSMHRPDPDVDEAVKGLGYTDKSKYGNIRLKDLQGKMGYTGDWRQDIHQAIELRGVDYDTHFTRLVKGIRGMDFYSKNKNVHRASREEIRKKRQNKQ